MQVFSENRSINVDDWFMIRLVWFWGRPAWAWLCCTHYFSYFPWLCGILHSQSHVLSIILCFSHVLIFFLSLLDYSSLCSRVVFDFFLSACAHFVIFIKICWWYLPRPSLSVFVMLFFCLANILYLHWIIDLWLVALTATTGVSHVVYPGNEPVFIRSPTEGGRGIGIILSYIV